MSSDFSISSTFNKNSQKPPGQLLFGRYRIVPIENLANWRLTYECKQTLTDQNNEGENSTQSDHKLKTDDYIILRNIQYNKYGNPYKEPYTVIQTFNNNK